MKTYIRTLSGSIYIIEQRMGMLTGGVLGEFYMKVAAIEYAVGKPAKFTLVNGQVITTSDVVSITTY